MKNQKSKKYSTKDQDKWSAEKIEQFKQLNSAIHKCILKTTLSHNRLPEIYKDDELKPLILTEEDAFDILDQFFLNYKVRQDDCFGAFKKLHEIFRIKKVTFPYDETLTHFAARTDNLQLLKYLEEKELIEPLKTNLDNKIPIYYTGSNKYNNGFSDTGEYLRKFGNIPEKCIIPEVPPEASPDNTLSLFFQQLLNKKTMPYQDYATKVLDNAKTLGISLQNIVEIVTIFKIIDQVECVRFLMNAKNHKQLNIIDKVYVLNELGKYALEQQNWPQLQEYVVQGLEQCTKFVSSSQPQTDNRVLNFFYETKSHLHQLLAYTKCKSYDFHGAIESYYEAFLASYKAFSVYPQNDSIAQKICILSEIISLSELLKDTKYIETIQKFLIEEAKLANDHKLVKILTCYNKLIADASKIDNVLAPFLLLDDSSPIENDLYHHLYTPLYDELEVRLKINLRDIAHIEIPTTPTLSINLLSIFTVLALQGNEDNLNTFITKTEKEQPYVTGHINWELAKYNGLKNLDKNLGSFVSQVR